jgi:hypothetical protein
MQIKGSKYTIFGTHHTHFPVDMISHFHTLCYILFVRLRVLKFAYHPSVMDVWEWEAGNFRKVPSVDLIVYKRWRRCERDEFALFVGIARKVWFRRNAVIRGGVFHRPNNLVREELESFEEYKKVNLKAIKLLNETKGGIQTKWQAPPTGIYKVNWDVVTKS